MKLCFALVTVFSLVVDVCLGDGRLKRAACDSSYGDWSEWSICDSDCGFCGTQTRSRLCGPISGCADVTCSWVFFLVNNTRWILNRRQALLRMYNKTWFFWKLSINHYILPGCKKTFFSVQLPKNNSTFWKY